MQPTNTSGETGIVDYSGRLLINDNIRHEIVLGNAYRFAHKFAAVAKAASVYLFLDPSANGAHPDQHFKLKAVVQSYAEQVKMEFYEGADVSANGTSITAFNFNRNPECDPTLNGNIILTHTPTVTSPGDKYAPDVHIYAAENTLGANTVTSPGDTTDEYSAFLHPAKKYLWKFTNEGDAATDIAIACRIINETDYKAGGR